MEQVVSDQAQLKMQPAKAVSFADFGVACAAYTGAMMLLSDTVPTLKGADMLLLALLGALSLCGALYGLGAYSPDRSPRTALLNGGMLTTVAQVVLALLFDLTPAALIAIVAANGAAVALMGAARLWRRESSLRGWRVPSMARLVSAR